VSRASVILRPREGLIAIVLVVGAGLAAAGLAFGGVGVWGPSHGPTGGDIQALTVDPRNPGTIFAAASGRVFKSTDAGDNWQVLDTGLEVRWGGVEAFAIDPLTTTTIYAGTSVGVLKSTDGGESWTQMNKGLDQYADVGALAIDPVTPAIVYAAAGRVYKSTDGGGSWRAFDASSAPTSAWRLALNPQRPRTVYAGTSEGAEIFKSTDGGASWRTVATGLAANQAEYVEAFAIDPLTPTTVYAGTDWGVFKSTDGGGRWRLFDKGMGRGVSALAIDPQTPTIIYAASRSGSVASRVRTQVAAGDAPAGTMTTSGSLRSIRGSRRPFTQGAGRTAPSRPRMGRVAGNQ
jgi:photosystem II stability/assembly factor-like uncharacterized protein